MASVARVAWLCAAVSACGGISTGKDSTTETPAPPTDPTPEPRQSGIAYLYENLPDLIDVDRAAYPPDMLYMILGKQRRRCEDPWSIVGPACGSWNLYLGIPPALLSSEVIRLDDPGIISQYTASDDDEPNPNSDLCYGESGAFSQGTLEILRIDPYETVIRLTGTLRSYDLDADGTHVIERCD
jgi:hypothetical protein